MECRTLVSDALAVKGYFNASVPLWARWRIIELAFGNESLNQWKRSPGECAWCGHWKSPARPVRNRYDTADVIVQGRRVYLCAWCSLDFGYSRLFPTPRCAGCEFPLGAREPDEGLWSVWVTPSREPRLCVACSFGFPRKTDGALVGAIVRAQLTSLRFEARLAQHVGKSREQAAVSVAHFAWCNPTLFEALRLHRTECDALIETVESVASEIVEGVARA